MRKHSKRPDAGGDFLILLAMAIFGAYGLILASYPTIPTLAFLFAFQVVGLITLYLTNRHVKLFRIRRKTFWLLAALALVAVGNDLFFFASLRQTTVATAVVTHQAVSIFLLFLAPVLTKQRTQKEEWLALIPSLAGIAVLYSQGFSIHSTHDVLGVTFGLISALFYGLLIILYGIVPHSEPGLNVRKVNFWRYLISTLLLLPFIPLLNLSSALQAKNVAVLIGFGILFAVVATGIHTLGLHRSRPLHASIIGKSEPVFAALYAYLFLSQRPPITTLLGGALIIAPGIWLVFRERKVKRGVQKRAVAP